MIVVLSRDLLISSRILAQADMVGTEALRIDHPTHLPPAHEVRVLFVDWTARDDDWGPLLSQWRVAGSEQPRLVLFGSHTDLAAHAAARKAGLGPMVARSKLMTDLPQLIG